MSKVVERFLNYVKYDTRSNDESTTVPTTPGQMVLAKAIAEELKQIGLQEVKVDVKGYVYATLPSNIEKEVPTIGFIAHMDTSPDMTGTNVNPQIVKNYDGGDIVLNKEQNIVLSPKQFPELKNYIGKTLITTDGTTLLGADDKAGVAEIVSAMEYLIQHPEIPHGKIRIGFTPDEEVGKGADHFDVEGFGADFAYTIDGGPIGELEYENFNAAGAKVRIRGRNVHPGTAKNKMINSMLVANEYIASLPENETPAYTEGYEGFYHLISMKGEVEETTLQYIIRDFDKTSFENRKKKMLEIAAKLNQKYGEGICTVELKDQYYNMKEKIEPVKHIVDTAFEAMRKVGIEPIVKPIRGGTDGARLSYMGLPTPNIFAGGHNFHGRYEFIPTFAMEKAVEVILKIVELYAKK
ncbi:peptidase T [Tepidibacillus sp. LV47]|uniref:peptidase T n=1 Tax=Tepidibacillus sp. LV47 TaxID=3398228 RepID=UPI003AAB6FE1